MLQRPRWEEVACADSTQILKAVIYAVSVLDGGPGYENWLLLIMLWIIRASDGPCSVNQEQTIQVAVSSHSTSPLFQNVFFVEQQAFALLFSPGFLLFFYLRLESLWLTTLARKYCDIGKAFDAIQW